MSHKKFIPTATLQKALLKLSNQSGGPNKPIGQITGFVGHLSEVPLFAAKWTTFMKERLEAFGPRFLVFDQGIVYTSHAEVKAFNAAKVQSRGPYFGPLRVYGTDYFFGYMPSITVSGKEHSPKRRFIERILPDPSEAAAKIDRLIEQELNKIALDGKLDLAQELQLVVIRLFHELILNLRLSEEEVKGSSRYLENIRWAALPNLFHRLTFNFLISKDLKHRRALIERYKRAEGFAALYQMSEGASEEEIGNSLFQTIHTAASLGTTALSGSVIGILASNDELRQQVIQEAYSVWDGKWPLEAADLARMTLLDQVMWETVRLQPPVRFLNQVAKEDGETTIDGAKCPFRKGTRLMLSLYHANRDPKIYDDPETFKLSRDFSHVMSWNNHSERVCPAMSLSQALVKRIALHVICNYKWEVKGSLEWEQNKFSPAIPKLALDPFSRA